MTSPGNDEIREPVRWPDSRGLSIRLRRAVCDLLGHRWVQPEGIFTKRWCDRCGQSPHLVGRQESEGPYPESVRRVMVDAARWWGSKRPVGWGNAQHEANPTVNCVGEVEGDLARSVAEHFGMTDAR